MYLYRCICTLYIHTTFYTSRSKTVRLVYLLYKIKTRMILPRVWLKSKMWYVLAVFVPRMKVPT